jgi:hypothetical protein
MDYLPMMRDMIEKRDALNAALAGLEILLDIGPGKCSPPDSIPKPEGADVVKSKGVGRGKYPRKPKATEPVEADHPLRRDLATGPAAPAESERHGKPLAQPGDGSLRGEILSWLKKAPRSSIELTGLMKKSMADISSACGAMKAQGRITNRRHDEVDCQMKWFYEEPK